MLRFPQKLKFSGIPNIPSLRKTVQRYCFFLTYARVCAFFVKNWVYLKAYPGERKKKKKRSKRIIKKKARPTTTMQVVVRCGYAQVNGRVREAAAKRHGGRSCRVDERMGELIIVKKGVEFPRPKGRISLSVRGNMVGGFVLRLQMSFQFRRSTEFC